MIITKEVIEEVLVKAIDFLPYSQKEIHRDVIEFANYLVGDNHKTAYKKIGLHMHCAVEEGYAYRNLFVPLARAFAKNVDWGFVEGEVVRYSFSPHTKRIGPILSIDGDRVEFKDIITSLSMVEKYIPEVTEEVKKESCQLSLF